MFRVMTWNLENLFLPGGQFGPTPEVFEAKLTGLANTINAQAPDLLAVQEVGDPDALDDLVERLDGDWEVRISDHPDRRGIPVGCLSRHPVSGSDDVVTFPALLRPIQADDAGNTGNAMGRGALAVTIDFDGRPVQVITAHLKSKLLEFPGGRFQPHDEDERARVGAYALYRRTAEATTLRVSATERLGPPDDVPALILTGDLNDTVQAATTQILLGPPGSEIGTPGFDRPDRGDAQRLWNLAPLMPEGRDFSRVTEGRRELIDHILVSYALVKQVDAVEAVVDQELPSVTNDPTARRNAPSSDHAPVVATFAI